MGKDAMVEKDKNRLLSSFRVCMLAVLLLAGCSKGGVPRVDLWGEVTWNGQPVPAGYVIFAPDSKRGNSGPQGIAVIKNGAYSTRKKEGRPAVPGPLVVTVHGFDGVSLGEDRPNGSRLFMPCDLPLTAPETSGELNIEVPPTVQPNHPAVVSRGETIDAAGFHTGKKVTAPDNVTLIM
jgi:hypothetical protein